VQEIFRRWTPGRRSEDLEDRRDEGGGGGGIGGMHIGIGGMLVLVVLSLVFKRDFVSLVGGQGVSSGQSVSQADPQRDAREEPTVQFVSFVLDDTQKTWAGILQAQGIPYQHAKLVLFRDATTSGCAQAQSATGPFYCPADQKVYIDLGFYNELEQRFGAPGKFAQAYVLAHELGHHIQDLLGIERKVRNLQGQNPGAGNALSVRMELQADCFAGIWAKSTQQRNLLESGGVESVLGAAAAVGDDRLQRMSGGWVSPESLTHGSSAPRMEWFQRGMNGGTIESCNIFQ
jgi:predicted metalloprotease